VSPGQTPDLVLRDPQEREANYLSALARWCKALPSNWSIAVAENSNWPSSRFAAIGDQFGRSIQVLQCEDRGSHEGKSIGEAGLVDDFAAAGLAQDFDWIFKCTGRLFVHNINACLPTLDGASGVCASIVPSLEHMDSRFFGASREVFLEYFTDMGEEIDEAENIYFEHIAARRMLLALSAGHRFLPFEELPYFIGRSASIGIPYHGGSIRAKWFLRQQVRRLMIDREVLL
jgi:hypothetical protein